MLSKEPSARYRTADQLGRLLMGFYETERSVSFPNENLQQLPKLEQVRPNLVTVGEPPAYTRTPTPAKEFTPSTAERTPTNLAFLSQASQSTEENMEILAEERVRAPIDWKTWSLGLLAAMLLLGLIPFWFYVYLLLKP